MFQLERRYIVLQHGNTVHLLPSALPPRLTNEARGANRAAHERWHHDICLTHTDTHTNILCARPYAEKMVLRKWGSSSALLFKEHRRKAWVSSPHLVPQEQPAGYFSDMDSG